MEVFFIQLFKLNAIDNENKYYPQNSRSLLNLQI